MGTVELRHGDIFDGPSDMIVLPCSTAGTITPFVREKLINFNIQVRPKRGSNLGDLQVHPFVGGENIAQFVAYAVSVEGSSSSLAAIHRIGREIGEHTRINRISRIACPLLGSGAGGLSSEAVVEKLKSGFQQTSSSDASLVISVLHESGLHHIAKNLTSPSKTDLCYTSKPAAIERPPRVFISYSHSTEEHSKWVASLGAFLRENGVDARLDIWHLRRGMDLPQFMTNELTLADRVILVSDEKYTEKSDGRVGGVGWETMIVQGDMSRLPPQSTKYLVVVTSSNIDDGLPQFLKTKFIIHWPKSATDGSNKLLLLREIFDAVRAPPIGPRPTLI